MKLNVYISNLIDLNANLFALDPEALEKILKIEKDKFRIKNYESNVPTWQPSYYMDYYSSEDLEKIGTPCVERELSFSLTEGILSRLDLRESDLLNSKKIEKILIPIGINWHLGDRSWRHPLSKGIRQIIKQDYEKKTDMIPCNEYEYTYIYYKLDKELIPYNLVFDTEVFRKLPRSEEGINEKKVIILGIVFQAIAGAKVFDPTLKQKEIIKVIKDEFKEINWDDYIIPMKVTDSIQRKDPENQFKYDRKQEVCELTKMREDFLYVDIYAKQKAADVIFEIKDMLNEFFDENGIGEIEGNLVGEDDGDIDILIKGSPKVNAKKIVSFLKKSKYGEYVKSITHIKEENNVKSEEVLYEK